MWLQGFAQSDDDDFAPVRRKDEMDGDELEQMIDYVPVRFTTKDVLTVVLLLVTCYVFGKIWKGCSYLILILAAIFYYMSR